MPTTAQHDADRFVGHAHAILAGLGITEVAKPGWPAGPDKVPSGYADLDPIVTGEAAVWELDAAQVAAARWAATLREAVGNTLDAKRAAELELRAERIGEVEALLTLALAQARAEHDHRVDHPCPACAEGRALDRCHNCGSPNCEGCAGE